MKDLELNNLQSEVLRTLHQRGFIFQATNIEGLDQRLKSPIVFYIGFDCTARSFHVGNLMQIMLIRTMQRYGPKPIILLGSGTTRIGDPTGKDKMRQMLDANIIELNKQGLKQCIQKFCEVGDNEFHEAILVDNYDWLKDINYIEFLREYGTLFSVNRMLSLESVKARLEREQNLSFLEFNYSLLQAYDFIHLNKSYNCILQFGGSDQWGNIVSGVELGRRVKALPELFGVTTPLITTASGAKMGKTVDGAIWLDPDMLSPYEYWQFWRNTEDADVIRFLKLYTDLSLKTIEEFTELKGREINSVKKVLANEATILCHGKEAALKAEDTARSTFENGGMGEDLPTYFFSLQEITAGIPIFKMLVLCKVCASNSEARRLVKEKGVKLNGILIENELFTINIHSFTDNCLQLFVGKKVRIIIKIQ